MKISLPLLTLVLFAGVAAAQPPPRVRGVIQAVEGQTLVVATENQGVVRLTLTDMTGINGLEKRAIADIKDNTFVGATAVGKRPRSTSFRSRCAAPARVTTLGTCRRAR